MRKAVLATLTALVLATGTYLLLSGRTPIELSSRLPSSRERRLRTVLDQFARDQLVSGSLTVLTKDGAIELAIGIANEQTGRRNDASTLFGIASCGKNYTAAAILRLEELGQLKTSDPVAPFFPELPRESFELGGVSATLDHVLRHTSGLFDVFEDAEIKRKVYRQNISVREYLDIVKRRVPSFPPGSSWEYSNTGYIVLGEVIRRTSGMSYDDFMKRHFIEPLHLSRTRIGPPDSTDPTLSLGYEKAGEGKRVDYLNHYRVTAPDLHLGEPNTDGNIFTTSSELALWIQSLTAGKILSPESRVKMFTPSKVKNYGYAWGIRQLRGRRAYTHTGDWLAYRCSMIAYPDENVIVAWLSNQNISNDVLAQFTEALDRALFPADG